MYKVFVKEVAIMVTSNKEDFPDHHAFSLKKVDFKKIVKRVKRGDLTKVVLYSKSHKKLLKRLHKKLPLVVAAGGLVINSNQHYLFIHRNGKWDLPKGKMDKNETVEQTALRETIEETGVQNLSINHYLGQTYHVFNWKEEMRLKLTHWYVMDSDYTGALQPEAVEGIDQAVWLSSEQAQAVLKDSYENIKDLFPATMLV